MVRKASPLIDKLLVRVARATSRYGEKSALARGMGVTPQHVNGWLTGLMLPSGETALQLLKWVTEAEEKQKKHAGRVSPRPALKTRNQKSTSNEKPRSSPGKGSSKTRRKSN